MLKQSIWSVVSRRHTWRGTWPKRCSGWVRRECYGWCSQGKSSAWVWADTRSTLSPPAGKKRKESRVKNIPCLAVHADVKTLSNHHLTFLMTVTWPRYPAVPLSIKGISAARHILFTWFRAAGEDKQIEFPLTTKQEAFAHTALKMRKFAYLGYPERSWPAETSWRIRRCSLD